MLLMKPYTCIRSCATGEGIFQFSTEEGKLIQAKLHSYAIQKAGRSRSASRRTSEVGYGKGFISSRRG